MRIKYYCDECAKAVGEKTMYMGVGLSLSEQADWERQQLSEAEAKIDELVPQWEEAAKAYTHARYAFGRLSGDLESAQSSLEYHRKALEKLEKDLG